MAGNMLSHFLTTVAKELAIPTDALFNILKDDDWSFIIKISSVIEKFLNLLLEDAISSKTLQELVFKLGLEKKIEIALDLKLINPEAATHFHFIRNLRNDAAHGIEFSFEQTFSTRDKLNSYKSQFKNIWSTKLTIGGHKVSSKTFMVENPKLTLFMAIAGHISIANIDKESKKLKSKSIQLLMKALKV